MLSYKLNFGAKVNKIFRNIFVDPQAFAKLYAICVVRGYTYINILQREDVKINVSLK